MFERLSQRTGECTLEITHACADSLKCYFPPHRWKFNCYSRGLASFYPPLFGERATVSRTQQIKHISIPDKIKMSVCKQRLPKTQVKKKNKIKINGTVPQICTHDIYRMYMLVLNRLFFFFQFWLSLNVQTCSNQYFCISDGLYDSAYRGRCHSWWQTRRDGAAGRCFQCNRSDTNLLHTAHKEGNKEERLAEGSHLRLKSGEDVRKGSVKGQFSWSASVILANATGGQYEVRGEVS